MCRGTEVSQAQDTAVVAEADHTQAVKSAEPAEPPRWSQMVEEADGLEEAEEMREHQLQLQEVYSAAAQHELEIYSPSHSQSSDEMSTWQANGQGTFQDFVPQCHQSIGQISHQQDEGHCTGQSICEISHQHSQGQCAGQTCLPPQHTPMPARALRTRLQSRSSTPPTWAAWLPKGLTQPPQSSVPQAPQFEDVPAMTPASADYMNGFYIDPEQWVPTGDGRFVGADGMLYEAMVFQTWPDADGTGAYYNDSQQECVQFDVSAQCHLTEGGGSLTGIVWKRSKESQGSRIVQDAFDSATTNEERMALTAELRGHVWEALKCPNANFVIQKCISIITPVDAQFVIDELMHRPGSVAQAARHRFGCRIIERLLEHCSVEQVSPLVEELLADTAALSSHVYGNYVVQHLLQHCAPDVVTRIAFILEQNVHALAGDGYAGSVIGTALTHAGVEESQSLARLLLKYPEQLASMACSRWGHLAVKAALKLAPLPEGQKACAELMWRSNWLRSNRYGRLVANAAAAMQTPQAPICAC